MSPSLILAAIIAVGLGLVYHLWRGGDFPRLIVSVLSACIGFAIGHYVGAFFGWRFILIGEIHLVEGLIGAMIVLVIVNRAD